MMSRSLYTLLALARLSSSRNDRMCTETSHGRFPTKSLVSSGLRSHGVRVMGWWEIGIGRARARGEIASASLREREKERESLCHSLAGEDERDHAAKQALLVWRNKLFILFKFGGSKRDK